MPRLPAYDGAMFFAWLERRRRRKILERPFPATWLAHIEGNVACFAHLDAREKGALRDLVQVFVEEKSWEGLGGLALDDEIRVTIAAQACLLVLELEHDLYRQVESILVYPSTVLAPARPTGVFGVATQPLDSPMPILGQAWERGPVILAWDAVRRGGRHAHDGRNVVYHEFAHKLDMLSDGADGVPPLACDETYERWVEVMTRAYRRLAKRAAEGRPTFLDGYALTNGAEFFAVATEHFFEQGLEMQKDHRAMYDVLRGFYRQDTAARALRRGGSR